MEMLKAVATDSTGFTTRQVNGCSPKMWQSTYQSQAQPYLPITASVDRMNSKQPASNDKEGGVHRIGVKTGKRLCLSTFKIEVKKGKGWG